MRLVLIVSFLTFILREVVCIFEFRRYSKIRYVKEIYSINEGMRLKFEFEIIFEKFNYEFTHCGIVSRKFLEEKFQKNLDIREKLNLDIKLNCEELEYIKNMWLKMNLGFPFLTRIEFMIFEKMKYFYKRLI